MFQHFELGQLPVSPWRNGGGATREVARHPQGAAADGFEWRVSVADIGADGPFSAYPGIDRSITLLEGAGVRMHSADGTLDHLLDVALRPFAFAGEHAIDATLLGGPSRDFNVMTRRGRWRAEARVLHGQAVLAPAPAWCGAPRPA
ncbi:HutD/Ves family protein, partial [Bordetella pertussis]